MTQPSMTEVELSELESKFAAAQAELLENFKAKLKSAADRAISDLYTDVLNHAASDAHVNYHNYLRDEFRQSFIKEISGENGRWSWAHDIRMQLLKNHPDVLRNKIIDDLQETIRSLKDQIRQLEERRY